MSAPQPRPLTAPESEADFPSAEAAADYWDRILAELAHWPVSEESAIDEPDPLF